MLQHLCQEYIFFIIILRSSEECDKESDRIENEIREENNESVYTPCGMYFLYNLFWYLGQF